MEENILEEVMKLIKPLNEIETEELSKLERIFGKKFDLIAMKDHLVYGYILAENFPEEYEQKEYKEKMSGIPEGFRGIYLGTEKEHSRYRKLMCRDILRKKN
ncbi:MAG: hypothetical protein ACP5NZ_01170 [Nanobdellota archaeon]